LTYLPLLHEVRQLSKELSPGIIIGWIFSVERHDVVVTLLHIFEEDLQLFCLSSRLLHAPLDDDRHLIFRMELGGIR
jgi:hypothetical protein